MKIINVIYKVLASICMILIISFIGITMLWVLFDPNREWMIAMPVWLRFVFLLLMIGMPSFMTYTEYLRLKKYK